ncbi:MAG: Ig-like domain-containing protein [Spirochaetota bacterium]
MVIMFSRPVQLADINATNIVIAPAGPAFGPVTSFAGGKGVRIPFVGTFAYNTTYTVDIVADLVESTTPSNSRFRWASSDFPAPMTRPNLRRDWIPPRTSTRS